MSTITPSAVVSNAGFEFPTVTAGYFDFFGIDFTENGLVTVTLDPNWGGVSHGLTQVISFYDFYDKIESFTGFQLVGTSGVLGIDQSDLSFAANSISLSIGSGSSWIRPGASFQAQIIFEGVSVPEPSTLFLLGSGLLGFVGLNRRRRT